MTREFTRYIQWHSDKNAAAAKMLLDKLPQYWLFIHLFAAVCLHAVSGRQYFSFRYLYLSHFFNVWFSILKMQACMWVTNTPQVRLMLNMAYFSDQDE